LPYDPVIPLLSAAQRIVRTQQRHLCTHVHHSTIHNSQALETTQIPYNWWMDQKNVYHIYWSICEFYSAIRNKGMWLESKWMQLEYIMLSEVNQTQKDKDHMFSLIHGR
jgi:adenine C2-methylase RlmN of 23S rRNA A2503 and tRNA A37